MKSLASRLYHLRREFNFAGLSVTLYHLLHGTSSI